MERLILKNDYGFGTMDNSIRKKRFGSLYCLDNNLKLHHVDEK